MIVRNFGGMFQLVVVDETDLRSIDQLDEARWAATSAPLKDLHCDPAFLAFVDHESKGRIRVQQIVEARDWLFARMVRRTRLREKSDLLLLEDLDTSHEEGTRLRRAADFVIGQLALPDKDRLALASVRTFRASYAKTLANGDGVVPPELLPEPAVAEFVRDVMSVVGGVPDASGNSGISAAELDRFLAQGKAYLAWQARGAEHPELLPFGDQSAAAAQAVRALDAKIEEFFLQCDLLRQQAQTAEALRLAPEEWRALRSRNATEIERYLEGSPLATPNADGVLPLGEPVNLVYRDAFEVLRERVLTPVAPAGSTVLTRALWRQVKAMLAPYEAWQKERPPEPFEKLPSERLRTDLEGPLAERARYFMGIDLAAKPEVEQVTQVERLILYQRWLIELANNFVNFSAVYDPNQRALVEMGSLVIDGRRLEFCIRVENRAEHKKVAQESLIFLVYAAITDQDGKPAAYEIAAPVTSGERGRIRVGKRGIFIDVEGREWDATIVEVVENPISIPEAIRAPFRRAKEFVGRKIEELAGSQLAAREKLVQEHLATGVTAAGATATGAAAPAAQPPGAPPPPGGASGMRDLLLGGGLAFAALGSAAAYVVSAFASVKPLNVLITVASLVAFIAAVSAFLGWLKLRRRDMGPLFEANGWAINAHMKLTRRLGRLFTRSPELPPGTRVERFDLIAAREDQTARGRMRTFWALVILLVLAAIAAALIYRHLHHHR